MKKFALLAAAATVSGLDCCCDANIKDFSNDCSTPPFNKNECEKEQEGCKFETGLSGTKCDVACYAKMSENKNTALIDLTRNKNRVMAPSLVDFKYDTTPVLVKGGTPTNLAKVINACGDYNDDNDPSKTSWSLFSSGTAQPMFGKYNIGLILVPSQANFKYFSTRNVGDHEAGYYSGDAGSGTLKTCPFYGKEASADAATAWTHISNQFKKILGAWKDTGKAEDWTEVATRGLPCSFGGILFRPTEETNQILCPSRAEHCGKNLDSVPASLMKKIGKAFGGTFPVFTYGITGKPDTGTSTLTKTHTCTEGGVCTAV